MSDLPPGKWSGLAVGHQWPSSSTLTTLSTAAGNRKTIGDSFAKYSIALEAIRSSQLASQEGATAQAMRDAFRLGARGADEITIRNLTGNDAYKSARDAVEELRSQLRDIASETNSMIEEIQASKEPVNVKTDRIINTVINARSRATIYAAENASNIYSAIQKILDKSEIEMSARAFAATNDFDPNRAFASVSRESVSEKATAIINSQSQLNHTQMGIGIRGDTAVPDKESDTDPASTLLKGGSTLQVLSHGSSESTSTPPRIPTSDLARRGTTAPGLPSTEATTGRRLMMRGVLEDGVTSSSLLSDSSITVTNQPSMKPMDSSSSHGWPSDTPTSAPTPRTPATASPLYPAMHPDAIAQSLNAATPTGAPISAGIEALSSSAAHSAEPQSPLHANTSIAPVVPTTTSSAATPLFEAAHAAPSAEPHSIAQTPAAQTVVATPTPIAPPVAAIQATPISSTSGASAGPLPAYGADIRSAATTTTVNPAPAPAAMPASAPTSSSHASGASTQPAVARQLTTNQHTQAAITLTENALAATSTGATTGATVTQSVAKQRLQRLLEAIARKEPALQWAIGDRSDGTTVATTDLAHGWIPPHVEIPTSLTLLQPARRNQTLVRMLGETTLIATYAPGQHIPDIGIDTDAPTSVQPRRTPHVEELGWELATATKWRDGLPRLAHTLAKAAITGTGCLESEVSLLREHLHRTAGEARNTYPDTPVNTIGNWQLLATIEALINDENISANYHFAWFLALNRSREANS